MGIMYVHFFWWKSKDCVLNKNPYFEHRLLGNNRNSVLWSKALPHRLRVTIYILYKFTASCVIPACSPVNSGQLDCVSVPKLGVEWRWSGKVGVSDKLRYHRCDYGGKMVPKVSPYFLWIPKYGIIIKNLRCVWKLGTPQIPFGNPSSNNLRKWYETLVVSPQEKSAAVPPSMATMASQWCLVYKPHK